MVLNALKIQEHYDKSNRTPVGHRLSLDCVHYNNRAALLQKIQAIICT